MTGRLHGRDCGKPCLARNLLFSQAIFIAFKCESVTAFLHHFHSRNLPFGFADIAGVTASTRVMSISARRHPTTASLISVLFQGEHANVVPLRCSYCLGTSGAKPLQQRAGISRWIGCRVDIQVEHKLMLLNPIRQRQQKFCLASQLSFSIIYQLSAIGS